MEAIAFLLTFIAILFAFLVGGDFTSASLSAGSVAAILLASFSYLEVHYFRHGELI